jgi:hypothetical protein
MAEYYSNGIGRSKKRKTRAYSGKSLMLFLLDVVVSIAMLLLIFSTVTAIICQYISPEKSGVLSVIALGAPIIYLLDIAVMFYWVVRWRWYRATAMICVVFIGLFYLSRYYKIDIDRHYDASYRESKYVKVMTYNALDGMAEGFVEYINSHNPDILCLQEIWDKKSLATLCEKYKSTNKEGDTSNNHIFSRHKICEIHIYITGYKVGVYNFLRVKFSANVYATPMAICILVPEKVVVHFFAVFFVAQRNVVFPHLR